MVTLDTKLELAKALFGREKRGGKTLGTTTIKGTVMADSSDGSVSVMVGEPDGSTTAADLTADMPIIGSATTGDEVDIIVQDGIPTAIAAPGWGDNIEGKVQYITFVDSGTDAGLHIHENATSYNTDGDLHLTSGGLEIRDSGSVLADFTASTIHLGMNSTAADPVSIDLMNSTGTIGIYDIGGDDYLGITSYYVMLNGEKILLKAEPTNVMGGTSRAAITSGLMGMSTITVKGYGIDDGNLPAHAQSIEMDTAELRLTLSDVLEVNGDAGTSGYVLTSQGAGSPPIWAAAGGGGSSYELIEDTRASAVATMTGTSSTIASLSNGDRILFHLEYTTAASSELALTLSGGTTVTKPVYRYGSTRLAANVGQAGAILPLTYLEPYTSGGATVEAGGAWVLDSFYDTNSNSIGYQLRTNSASLLPNFAGRRYRLWFTSADNTRWVCSNKSTATNNTTARTLDTATKINPFGPIVYRSTNGTADTAAVLEVAALWQQYVLDLRYTVGPVTLTTNAPVYMKCTPNTDGSAYLHSVTQSLPSTNDGYIYIYLGIAYSSTNMELRAEHPVYYHDGTALKVWTGAAGSYTLPAATTSTMGGVIVGTGLDVNSGTVSLADMESDPGVDVGQGMPMTLLAYVEDYMNGNGMSAADIPLGSETLDSFIQGNSGEASSTEWLDAIWLTFAALADKISQL